MASIPERGQREQGVNACGCAAPTAASLWRWGRIAFSAVLAVNTMAVTLAVNTSPDAQDDLRAARLGLLAATLLVGMLVGNHLVRGAWRSLRARRLSVEFLFVLTLGGAFGVSLQSMWFREGPVYFEVVGILLVVYAFGAELNRAARDRALQAVAALSLEQRRARLREPDGTTRMVAAEAVQPGDVVEVLPGEMAPVDGALLVQPALVEEASLRGEYAPMARQPGEMMLAGSTIVDSMALLRATGPGHAKSLDAVLCEVNQALETPPAMQQAADRLARWFVPVVSGVAVATFFGWAWIGPFEDALFHAMAVLLVACPCALGFGTPLAFWTATARLRQIGIHVGRTADVEALAAVDCVAFDKTGTLSSADATLREICWDGTLMLPQARVMACIEAAEKEVAHPFARAFTRYLAQHGGTGSGTEWRRETLQVLPGRGLRATLGNAAGDTHTIELVRREDNDGIEFRVDGIRAGFASFAEELHPRRTEALAWLHELGAEPILLTGDHPRRAAAAGVARFHAGMTPMEKRTMVEQLKADGRRVLFVGDGINDAPAMAVSDAAIAVGLGAPLARAVAGITWAGANPVAIPAALRIARATLRRVRTNFRWAIGYNLAGMTLAAAGMLHPVTAAFLMVASSTLITWRAMALLEHAGEDMPLRQDGAGACEISAQPTAAVSG